MANPLSFLELALDTLGEGLNVLPATGAAVEYLQRPDQEEIEDAIINAGAERVTLPDDKLMLVAVDGEDEAHYICGLLNSSSAQLLVASYVVETQTGTHILQKVRVPKFGPERPPHRRLSRLSREAQAMAAIGDTARLGPIEQEIDEAAAKL